MRGEGAFLYIPFFHVMITTVRSYDLRSDELNEVLSFLRLDAHAMLVDEITASYTREVECLFMENIMWSRRTSAQRSVFVCVTSDLCRCHMLFVFPILLSHLTPNAQLSLYSKPSQSISLRSLFSWNYQSANLSSKLWAPPLCLLRTVSTLHSRMPCVPPHYNFPPFP